jgi:integrase
MVGRAGEAVADGYACNAIERMGVRRGEVLALRWADVDLDAGTVAVLGSLQRVPTKTAAPRERFRCRHPAWKLCERIGHGRTPIAWRLVRGG